MRVGDLVVLDMPHKPDGKKIGMVIKVVKPNLNGDAMFKNRITYHVFVDGKIETDLLYEHMFELNEAA